MKTVLSPTRIIHFSLLLTLVVLGLTGMWRSSTSGLKSGLSRFTRGGVEPKIVKEKVVQGGLDQEEATLVGPGGEEAGKEKEKKKRDKLVTAHFMLGNTYPYTDSNWTSTLDLAAQTGVDALALNLGPEEWQSTRARSAYRLASQNLLTSDRNRDETVQRGGRPKSSPKLFISLDMNVLPSTTHEDMSSLVDLVLEFAAFPSQLRVPSGTTQSDAPGRHQGKVVLSTFGGGESQFGGAGWEGFLAACRERGEEIYFIPAFFLPPEKILGMDHVDGVLNWNAAWPMGNYTTSVIEDRPFVQSNKTYMAAVSPWFFTHYGKTGDWAWNKNWIYRSDDHLYATRWLNILSPDIDPDFVQIISWNDYGESHYIGPILGAQPGSERWTEGMPHEGWRKMTEWFIRRYKGVSLSSETETRVYLSYRLYSRDCQVEGDEVGKPDRAEFAQDVISLTVTMPGDTSSTSRLVLAIKAGHDSYQQIVLEPEHGIAMALVPFTPGDVSFSLLKDEKQILTGQGESIRANKQAGSLYNFNAWTGSWGTVETS